MSKSDVWRIKTRSCRDKKCPHCKLVEGYFGYRCTHEDRNRIPGNMVQCPLEVKE